ncbi:unnamed protein product [Toxocara canis]|uniref:RNA-directed DNA polymerase n=1 Tax=Toxocara canis TaxID=6265 RepID=A0A183UR92_TOXCA|nr:unnamed protein product [Toxocara canis]
MPEPSDTAKLRSLLEMVNYYQSFVDNIRFIRRPLDKLLKKDARWKLTQQQKNSFQQLKNILQSDLLTHYDPKLSTVVGADAPDYGIGAIIHHRRSNGFFKPVAHASRILTTKEQNYSQIEKELALISAVTNLFHRSSTKWSLTNISRF